MKRESQNRLASNLARTLLFAMLVIWLPQWSLLAQERLFQFDRIHKTARGNPDINSITQDEQGFIWLGTIPEGVIRYDGYDFREFQHDPADSTSLSDNEVREVFAPGDGTLWVGTAAGLDRLDFLTERFRRFTHDPTDPTSIPETGVNEILDAPNGQFWIGSDAGLLLLNPDTAEFSQIELMATVDPSRSEPTVWSMFADQGDILWIGTLRDGLFRYDIRNQSVQYYFHDPDDPQGLPNDFVHYILRDSRGTLWFATDAGLSYLDSETGDFVNYRDLRQHGPESALAHRASYLLEDSQGNFWIGLWRGGLALYDRDRDTVQHIVHDPSDPNSIGAGRVWQMLEDRSGNVWIDSRSLNKLTPNAQAIVLYTNPLDGSAGTGVPPYAIHLDQDNIFWLGTKTGLFSFDASSVTWNRVDAALPFPDVFAVYSDDSGNLWFSTRTGLHSLDKRTRQYETYAIPGPASNIIKDRDGVVWSALPQIGLGRLDTKTGQFSILKNAPDDENSLSTDHPMVVELDRSGQLWIGTINGLNRYDRLKETFSRYTHHPDDSGSLSHREIRSLLEDRSGSMWIGTGDGLNRYAPDADAFERYSSVNADFTEWIEYLVEGVDGRLYLNFVHSLSRFDPATSEFRNARMLVGGILGLGESLVVDQAGRIWGGINRGLIEIDPDLLFAQRDRPSPVVTEFRLFNDPVAIQPEKDDSALAVAISHSKEINLDWNDSLFSFQFSALDYVDPDRIQYSYLLDGFDPAWIPSDPASRVATYSRVPPGNYVFRVRAADMDGIWETQTVSLGVNVAPPFWRTWWAYLTYIAATVMSIGAFVQLRTRALKTRAAVLEETVGERTRQIEEQAEKLEHTLQVKERLFTNVSHEFRTPLTLILGPVDKMLRSGIPEDIKSDVQLIKQNGRRLLRLVDQLLEISRLNADQPIRKTPQPVSQIIRAVAESFRPMADARQIHFKVDVDSGCWTMATAEAVEKISMNLLSNAFKYTPKAGSIGVSLSRDDEYVSLIVSDSGIGIPENRHGDVFDRFVRADDSGERHPGAGIGLAIVKEYVDALAGNISLESSPGSGTTVVIELPRQVLADEDESVLQEFDVSDEVSRELESVRSADPVNELSTDANGARTVLIIEDSADMRQYLHQLLADEFTCIAAEDGDAGLKLAYEHVPDMILCDVMLPRRNGYEVSRELKSDIRTSHIPIVMLTAKGDQDSRIRGLQESVDDYIAKPFDNEELLARLRNLLAIREKLRETFILAGSGTPGPGSGWSAKDREFIDRIEGLIESNLSNTKLRLEDLSKALAMSERPLQRKLKALTGHTPAIYIRKFRLQRAKPLLRDGMPVYLVSDSVGFSSPAYFTSCFKEEFGLAPSEYIKTGSPAGNPGHS
jgi:signal transduction histidine kinase/DNA-binding response OmpR family regulator/streptogramin lyase